MKHIIQLAFLVLPLLPFSCQQDETYVEPASQGGTAILKLEGGLTGFDESTTRGMTYAWEDGARIYLRFQNDTEEVEGDATYDAAEDIWKVNYYGVIAKDKKTKCVVYYFENPDTITNNSVELGPNSTVYVDTEGSYLFAGGVILLYADMKPLTARVRFQGTPGSEISFEFQREINGSRKFKAVLKSAEDGAEGKRLVLTLEDGTEVPCAYADVKSARLVPHF